MNGHMVARVRVSDEMMTTAKDWAKKIQRLDSEAGFKETFEGRHIGWEMAGLVGHLAAGEYLFGDWRKALESIEAGPTAADFMFQGQALDVKTAGGENDRFLLVPVAKFMKRHPHVYIGAQLKAHREVWIWGYATCEDIASAPVKDFGQAPAHYIALRSLRPIDDLVPADSTLLRYMTCVMTSAQIEAVLREYVQQSFGRSSGKTARPLRCR